MTCRNARHVVVELVSSGYVDENLASQLPKGTCSVNPVFGRVILKELHLRDERMHAKSCFDGPSWLAAFSRAVPRVSQYDSSGPTSQSMQPAA